MKTTIDYLLALDALKHVQRRNYLNPNDKGETRLENSAEHSWHLAMACWVFAQKFALPVNHEKLLKMALVHDLGEIDAGDTFLFAANRHDAHIDERLGVARLANHTGNPIADMLDLWEEQETGSSLETKLIKMVDRILPFMLNMVNQGGAWRDHQVNVAQVRQALAFIQADFPDVHAWLMSEIDHAIAQGWLAAE